MKNVDLSFSQDLEIIVTVSRLYFKEEVIKKDLPTVKTLLKRDILFEVGDSISLPEFNDEPMTITRVFFSFNTTGQVYRIIIAAQFN